MGWKDSPLVTDAYKSSSEAAAPATPPVRAPLPPVYVAGIGTIPVEDILQGLANHPTLAKLLGGAGGAIAGAPAGPAGMIGLGALGAAGAGSYSQLAQHAVESPDAPQTSGAAASQVGQDALSGALTGATMAGGAAAAPPLLRAIASPGAQAAIAGGTTLAKGGGPLEALRNAAEVGVLGRVGNSPALMRGAASGIERLALMAKTGFTLAKEAPEAVKAFAQEGGTVGNVLPFKQASEALGDEVSKKIVGWRLAGWDRAKMTAALNDLHEVPPEVGNKMIDMVNQRFKLPETGTIPSPGNVKMATVGGGKASAARSFADAELAAKQKALLGNQPNPFASGE